LVNTNLFIFRSLQPHRVVVGVRPRTAVPGKHSKNIACMLISLVVEPLDSMQKKWLFEINICLHYYCVLHWKQGIDSIFSFQISLHMGRRWGPYGHTHMGLPSHIPYGTNMGFIWACPSGFAQSHPIWDQYGVYMGVPIWAYPIVVRMGPILSCLLGCRLRSNCLLQFIPHGFLLLKLLRILTTELVKPLFSKHSVSSCSSA